MKHLLLFLIALIPHLGIQAQITHGTIYYDGFVEWVIDPNGDTIFMSSADPRYDIAAVAHFNEDFTHFELIATIAYSIQRVVDKKQGHVLFIDNDFGEKTAETWIMDELEDMDSLIQLKNPKDSLFLVLKENEKRNIAGYNCDHATYSEFGTIKHCWYTAAIDPGELFYPVLADVPGTCLGFSFEFKSASFWFEAQYVDMRPPDPAFFEMRIPYGYELVGEPAFPVILPEKREPPRSNEIPPPPPPMPPR